MNPVPIARGENHVVTTRGAFLFCEVWSRPDLDSDKGARAAEQLVTTLTSTIVDPTSLYRGIQLDVRRVQPAFGPATRAALAKLFGIATTRAVRIAVVVGDSAIQMLQFRRLCTEVPGAATVFVKEADAIEWLKAPLLRGPSGP